MAYRCKVEQCTLASVDTISKKMVAMVVGSGPKCAPRPAPTARTATLATAKHAAWRAPLPVASGQWQQLASRSLVKALEVRIANLQQQAAPAVSGDRHTIKAAACRAGDMPGTWRHSNIMLASYFRAPSSIVACQAADVAQQERH